MTQQILQVNFILPGKRYKNTSFPFGRTSPKLLIGRILFSITLLSLLFFTQIRPVAAGNPAGGQNSEKENGNNPPDPCQQLIKANGQAEGLVRRCEAIGTGGGVARGDFNGDGASDLAIGVPYESKNEFNAVGGVNIIYGNNRRVYDPNNPFQNDGLAATGNQFLDESTFGFPYSSNDHFGWSLASGDFNKDGFSDLAIGMPDWDLVQNGVRTPDVGRVFVITGDADGLNMSTVRTLGSLKRGRAGAALVWADFDGDSFGDLAVGVPNASVDQFIGDDLFCWGFTISVSNAGSVQLFHGSSAGLKETGIDSFDEGRQCRLPGGGRRHHIGIDAQDGARVGSVLAAGNFNAFRPDFGDVDPAMDLVIGVPLRDIGPENERDAGAVYVVFNTSSFLNAGGRIISQATPGVSDTAEVGDQFGRSLAVGSLVRNRTTITLDDLAVGIPFEDLDGKINAGAVQIFQPSLGRVGDTDVLFSQGNLPGVGVESYDLFGWALAVGDFGSGDALAIGTPGEDIGSISNAGLVTVIQQIGEDYYHPLQNSKNWTQNTGGMGTDGAEADDQFGYALSSWNYDNGGGADLAIGAPFEDVRSADGTLKVDAGAVSIIYGSGSDTGLSAIPLQYPYIAPAAQFWTQDSLSIKDVAQTGDRFGSSLY